MLRILLIDDEPALTLAVSDQLRSRGYHVDVANTGERAIARLADTDYDVIICDLLLPDTHGLVLLRQLRTEQPDADVLMITGHGTVTDAVAALKAGATDFLTKPFDIQLLEHELVRIGDRRTLEAQLAATRAQLETVSSGFVGGSPATRRLLEKVNVLGASEAPILILGESGAGKELIARRLHDVSDRRLRPMVTVNCASFPDTLIEAELFGYERGAFTGATKARVGRFKAADGGTLFLDEVGELPLVVQAKLLRVLQDSTFEPLGTNLTQRVNVRVVSATHRPLKKLIEEGLFREDLYYRLKVLALRVPPLRERRADIPELVAHFINRFAGAGRISGMDSEAWSVISRYEFPGNVRELEHAVHHAIVLAGEGILRRHHLPDDLLDAVPDVPYGRTTRFGHPDVDAIEPLGRAVKQFERDYLAAALDAHKGNRTATAETLGISRKNLWEKLRAHALTHAKHNPKAVL